MLLLRHNVSCELCISQGSRTGSQICCLDGRSVSRPGSNSASSPQGETWLRCERRNVSSDFPMIGRPWYEWFKSASVRKGSAHLLGIQIQCVLHRQASSGPPSLRWRLATLRAEYSSPLNPCYLSSLPEALKTQLKETQRAAFAEGTYSNLLIQWRVFLSFCDQYQYPMVPAATETICLFAQFLANRFKSPGSVRNHVNGVRVLHMLMDKPVEAFHSPELKITLRGIARLKQHHPRRASAITPEMLLCMEKHMDRANCVDIVIWAATLLAFFCLLRKSNYVPISVKKFDKSRQLCRGISLLAQTVCWSTLNGQKQLSLLKGAYLFL